MSHEQFMDLSGLQCPMPLLKTKLKLAELEEGESLHVVATDPGSARDIPAYLALTEHELSRTYESDDGKYHFLIVSRTGRSTC